MNHVFYHEMKNKWGRTPIVVATEESEWEVVQELAASDANIEVVVLLL